MLAALKKKKKNVFSSVLEDKYKRMPYGMFMLKMKISGVSSIEERESWRMYLRSVPINSNLR